MTGPDAGRRLPADFVLSDGEMGACEVDGEALVVSRIDGRYYAVRDLCTHAEQKLSEGRKRGTTLYCPLHGARFDLRDGRCLSGPATENVAAWTVHEEEGGLVIGERLERSQTTLRG